jgi:hypothetical protein
MKRSPDRIARETAAIERLNWIRVHNPRRYDELMVLLAQLVSTARTARRRAA